MPILHQKSAHDFHRNFKTMYTLGEPNPDFFKMTIFLGFISAKTILYDVLAFKYHKIVFFKKSGLGSPRVYTV